MPFRDRREAGRHLADALALELAEANSAVAPMNTADGDVGDEHDGLDTRFDEADS